MDAYAKYWGNGAKLLLVLAATMLFASIFSTQATSWVTYSQSGSQVNQDFSAVAGALGQPWVYLVPLSGLAILLGLYFVWDVEGREGMMWRKRWVPMLIAILILAVALVVIVLVAWTLDKEMMRRGLSFWNNAGGGWYLALTGATLGIFAILFGAIVTRKSKHASKAGAMNPQSGDAPPPPPDQMAFGGPAQGQSTGQQQSWPEYSAYGQQNQAQAAPPPPPSQYDQNYIPPQPPDQPMAPFDAGAGAGAPPQKPKKKWFGK